MNISYDEIMKDVPLAIELRIVADQPVELLDFVSQFSALSSQFEKYIKQNHPDLKGEAKIYVREMRSGSILADLLPWTLAIIDQMDRTMIVEEFVRKYGSRLLAYSKKGGRDKEASKSDLKDFMAAVGAMANDPNGRTELKAVSFEDGKREVRAHIQFSTSEAKTAICEIEQHKKELDASSYADRERVFMYFKRTDKDDATLGKRSGERVIIEEISNNDLALAYASDIAETRIKDEIRHSVIYEKGFIVDVNITTNGGTPVLYTITDLRKVIDLPKEDKS